MKPAIITNIIINGKRTKNHDNELYPALQNTSKSHVKNNMYINFAKNIPDVFET